MSAGVLLPPGPKALLPGAPSDGPPANGPPADGPGDILTVGPSAAGAIALPDGPLADGAIPLPDDGPPATGEEEPGVLVDGPFATGDIAGVTVAGDGGDAVEPEGVGDEVGDLPEQTDKLYDSIYVQYVKNRTKLNVESIKSKFYIYLQE